MIEDVILFVQEFIKLDYAVRVAQFKEKDDDIFETELDKLNQYYFGEIASDIYRQIPVSPEILQNANTYLNSIQGKKFFRVEQFRYHENENFYCAYLSSYFSGDNDYYSKSYISLIQNEFKILSEYNICQDCEGSGMISNKKCEECSGVGWKWQGGIEVNIQSKPIKVIKLLNPTSVEV